MFTRFPCPNCSTEDQGLGTCSNCGWTILSETEARPPRVEPRREPVREEIPAPRREEREGLTLKKVFPWLLGALFICCILAALAATLVARSYEPLAEVTPTTESGAAATEAPTEPPVEGCVQTQFPTYEPPAGFYWIWDSQKCDWVPAPFPATAIPAPLGPVAPPVQSSCQPGQSDLSVGLKWGPAGYAPQTLHDAMNVLGVSNADSIYLTVLNSCPGDDRVIGWVLGTTASQNAGIRVSANSVPAGTIVDYDPGVTSFQGSLANTVAFTSKWSRSDAVSQLYVSTLKITIYWTVRDDAGFTTSSFNADPTSTTFSCPILGGIQTNPMSDGGCKLISDHAVTFVVPSNTKVLYDDGQTVGGVWAYQGQTVTTYTASVYPLP